MTLPDELPAERPDLLIGTPERDDAHEALEAHLIAQRLDGAEFERRTEACKVARTRAELLRVFADLPPPHPQLPPAVPATGPVTPAEPDEDMPPVVVVGCLTLALGLPVALVVGFVYGAWWALAVPVAVTVAMAYGEQLRTR